MPAAKIYFMPLSPAAFANATPATAPVADPTSSSRPTESMADRVRQQT